MLNKTNKVVIVFTSPVEIRYFLQLLLNNIKPILLKSVDITSSASTTPLTMNLVSILSMTSISANSASGSSSLYFTIMSTILKSNNDECYPIDKFRTRQFNAYTSDFFTYFWYWMYCFRHSGVMWAPSTLANFIFLPQLSSYFAVVFFLVKLSLDSWGCRGKVRWATN